MSCDCCGSSSSTSSTSTTTTEDCDVECFAEFSPLSQEIGAEIEISVRACNSCFEEGSDFDVEIETETSSWTPTGSTPPENCSESSTTFDLHGTTEGFEEITVRVIWPNGRICEVVETVEWLPEEGGFAGLTWDEDEKLWL